ncbi:MAG: YfiR family protein, partial [Bacteroidota bacterium]
ILEKVEKRTLTVSEEEGYAKRGTAFNFVIKNDKLKFESNLNAINAAGLKAGSQLLKLAILVN